MFVFAIYNEQFSLKNCTIRQLRNMKLNVFIMILSLTMKLIVLFISSRTAKLRGKGVKGVKAGNCHRNVP